MFFFEYPLSLFKQKKNICLGVQWVDVGGRQRFKILFENGIKD